MPVDLVAGETGLGLVIGVGHAGRPGRAARRPQAGDRAAHLQLLIARRRLQRGARALGVIGDGQRVLGPQPVDGQVHRLLGQVQLVGLRIDPDTSTRKVRVQRTPLLGGQLIALQADMNDLTPPSLALGAPGRGCDRRGDGERPALRGRPGVVVVEGVDHLLDPHSILGRRAPLVDEAPHVRIGGRVHVDGEGRDRLVAGPLHGIGRGVGIAFGVGRRGQARGRGHDGRNPGPP